MSFIISKGKLIAKTATTLKSGTNVQFSSQLVPERINANRQWNLVNASQGKISNDQKWQALYIKSESVLGATEINPREFYL